MRRAEEADGGAEGVSDGVAGIDEFGPDAGVRAQGKFGVGHGVVADGVAVGKDAAGEASLRERVAADEEEGGLGMVFGEEVEEEGGGGGVGAVVKGEGQLFGSGRGAEEWAEELG